ncbi:hypothetical protein TNCV_1619731 [Trichonephila clavipes]|nr:hypothetical protein TNCV_1619731 [Trichonephila clavipes]
MNITSCRNKVGTLGTKDEEVTAEMDRDKILVGEYWATGNSEVQKNGGVETSAYFRVQQSYGSQEDA